MSEHQHQVALFKWADMLEGRFPELQWLYAVPNGQLRDKRIAAKLKREGVKPGVLDVHLDVARRGYHGWRGELKVGKNKPTKAQTAWIDHHRSQRYYAEWFVGWEAMSNSLEWYLNG